METLTYIGEIWRPVKGYEGLYEVSNKGRVRSLARNSTKGKLLKFWQRPDKRLEVTLCKDGKTKKYKVHRLVAIAFIPNPLNLPEVNHKDENPTNNCVENLEWCDNLYNIRYGTGRKRMGLAHSKTLYQYSADGELLNIFSSGREVERQTNGKFKSSNISAGCRGVYSKNNMPYGYVWRYEEWKN